MTTAHLTRPWRHGSAGAALVLVLWLVAALSLTVLAGAKGLRQQTQQAGLALERLRAEGVRIVSREMAVFEWLHQAGDDRFRAISREFLR